MPVLLQFFKLRFSFVSEIIKWVFFFGTPFRIKNERERDRGVVKFKVTVILHYGHNSLTVLFETSLGKE